MNRVYFAEKQRRQNAQNKRARPRLVGQATQGGGDAKNRPFPTSPQSLFKASQNAKF